VTIISTVKSQGYYLAKNVHILKRTHFYQPPVMKEVSDGSSKQHSGFIYKRGVCIGFLEIGQMLSFGINEVHVHKKVRVAILSFREELVYWDSNNNTGIDINGLVLEAMVKECGGIIVARKLIRDAKTIHEEIRVNLEKCDMLLLTGYSRVLNKLNHFSRNVLLKHIRVSAGEEAFFLTDCRSGKNKIVFGLPCTLFRVIMLFHLLVKPSLK